MHGVPAFGRLRSCEGRLVSSYDDLEIGARDAWAEAGARKIPLDLDLSPKKVDYR